nr:(2Fe-2S)-binding protein [Caldimonas sp.]
MIVCVCQRVSDRAIASAVHAGCGSFEQLQADLGVGTGCGACRGCARETFERHAAGRCAPCTAAPHAALGSVAAVATHAAFGGAAAA